MNTLSRDQFLKTLSAMSLSTLGIFSFTKSHAEKAAQKIIPIMASSESSAKDFEFYEGMWTIRNKRLKTLFSNANDWYEFDATEVIEKRLDGLGYVGKYKTILNDKPFEGLAVHLFDPKTKLWSNWWADSFRGVMDPPVVGSYKNKIGTFYAKDNWNGKEVDLEFHWDTNDRDNPVWKQSFSLDKGKTWEVNWIMYYKRSL
jgi:hypothetical protein